MLKVGSRAWPTSNSMSIHPSQTNGPRVSMKTRVTIKAILLLAGALGAGATAVAETTADKIFRLHEVTIDGIHAGIQSGAITCKGVVEAYVARARAYNGSCTMPVTADGGSIPKVKGAV